MILTCPNCGTQYVVKDGAIPPEGRHVRCAACKHSWHQDPETGAQESVRAAASETAQIAETVPEGEADVAANGDESLAEATMIEPRSGPESEERAYEEAAIGASVPTTSESAGTVRAAETAEERPPEQGQVEVGSGELATADPAADTFSPFIENGDVEPKRRSVASTIVIVAIVVIIVAALFWFFAPPEIKAKLGLVAAGASPLSLVTTHMDRQKLESGQEFLTVTGRIINPTAKAQDIPPLQAQLKNRTGKIVYSWTIAPPARSLAAGSSTSFNSAEVNVPPDANELTITLGGPKA